MRGGRRREKETGRQRKRDRETGESSHSLPPSTAVGPPHRANIRPSLISNFSFAPILTVRLSCKTDHSHCILVIPTHSPFTLKTETPQPRFSPSLTKHEAARGHGMRINTNSTIHVVADSGRSEQQRVTPPN